MLLNFEFASKSSSFALKEQSLNRPLIRNIDWWVKIKPKSDTYKGEQH